MSCAKEKTPYKTAMNWSRWAITLIAICLVSCETAHEIGRAITAPVRYVLNEPEPAHATSQVAANRPSAKPSPSPQKSASATQFPVARPVPGKPGLVFNPFNASGGYIDVSGYAPGSRVKDPDSQQIFIVP